MPTPIALASLQQRFLNRPMALAESHAWLLASLARGNVTALAIDPAAERDRTYDVVAGVAVIPVRGMLVHGRTWWFCETAYNEISAALVAAAQDAEVKAIVLWLNSPGGEVAGMLDLADGIYGLRGVKPIWAILDEDAYSAAYLIACAADRVVVPRTGGTGSIGTIAQHFDITGMLDKAGVKTTTFKSGARKGDGWPTIAISEQAAEAFQADIDAMAGFFFDQVARNRDLSVAAVRKLEAACFLGARGVDAKLADAVMTPDDAFLDLIDSIR